MIVASITLPTMKISQYKREETWIMNQNSFVDKEKRVWTLARIYLGAEAESFSGHFVFVAQNSRTRGEIV